MSRTITIGPYVEGEIPEPIAYRFLDDAGAPLDLTGYTATFKLKIGTAAVEVLDAAVTDAADGKVTHTWLTGEIEAGSLSARFWVTNGTNKFASKRFIAVVETE